MVCGWQKQAWKPSLRTRFVPDNTVTYNFESSLMKRSRLQNDVEIEIELTHDQKVVYDQHISRVVCRFHSLSSGLTTHPHSLMVVEHFFRVGRCFEVSRKFKKSCTKGTPLESSSSGRHMAA